MDWMSVPIENQAHSIKLCGFYGPVPIILYCKACTTVLLKQKYNFWLFEGNWSVPSYYLIN